MAEVSTNHNHKMHLPSHIIPTPAGALMICLSLLLVCGLFVYILTTPTPDVNIVRSGAIILLPINIIALGLYLRVPDRSIPTAKLIGLGLSMMGVVSAVLVLFATV